MKQSISFILIAVLLQLKAWGQCPTADAGPDMIQCSSNIFELNGTVTNGNAGYWTSSSGGDFAPNAYALNAFYIMPYAEDGGYSMLVLTAVQSGCPDVKDTMHVFYNAPIGVRNGFSQSPACCYTDPTYLTETTVCSNTASVNVYGVVYMGNPNSGGYPVTWPNTGIWSTSGSGSFTNPTAVNTEYNLSAGDIISGSVTLTLTSTDMGDCNNVSDDLIINIETCLGVNDFQINSSIISYYDETGSAHIKLPDDFNNGELFIHNSSGVLACSLDVFSSNDVEVKNLPKGIYFIKAVSSKNYVSGKIIIQ